MRVHSMRALQLLLLFLPVALLAHLAGTGEIFVFAASALAIIPLAKILGEATEVLAEKTGPRIGGLLNATFGNAAELIIKIFGGQCIRQQSPARVCLRVPVAARAGPRGLQPI
jgi:Ca2+/H+ antiporter